MNGIQLVLFILAAVAVVFGGLWFLIPYLVKKGINMESVLSTTGTALETAELVVEGLVDIFPENKGLTIVNSIIDYAKKGVEAAEKLYLTSKIEASQRNAKAKEIVYECLGIAGIDLTEAICKVVDGMIEAAVLVLPKTHGDEGDAPAKEYSDEGQGATA